MSKLSILVLLAVLWGCQKETQVTISNADNPQFSVREVLAVSTALTAIIDWPAETISVQKNLNVSPEQARNLILPVHPLWDEKGAAVLSQMSQWDAQKVKSVEAECKQFCECDFYLDLISRHPEILQGADPAFVAFSKMSYVKQKSDVLRCLETLPSLQNILGYLRKEQTQYKADSAI